VRNFYAFLERDTRTASITRIALSTLCILLVWQLLALVVTNRLLLVPPAEVASALMKELKAGAIATNALA
jgi:ABC-type nitrate/sulfonate/bicarbonate transport system permease component